MNYHMKTGLLVEVSARGPALLVSALAALATACGVAHEHDPWDTADEDQFLARAGQTQELTEPLPGRPVPPLGKPPEPSQLDEIVRDKQAVILLGKALFWDMQVGSDNVQACASCHFNAGADSRSKNQISPGLLARDPNSFEPAPDRQFDRPPNYQLTAADFPLRKLADPSDRTSKVLRDTNDSVASQGVFHAVFGEKAPYGPDPDGYRVGDTNVRRVEPRNTPTTINAVYNHRNFWDGRAQSMFNGVNPFGDRDPKAHVYRKAARGSDLVPVKLRLDNSSLASQAVGPPTNEFEMSERGREFPDIARSLALHHRKLGRKLEPVRPLGLQLVHPQDSVLGKKSRWPKTGLEVGSYGSLIREAFQPQWWASDRLIHVAKDGSTSVVRPRKGLKADENTFTLLEYNFSMFFGVAIQAYEATLISDDSPFDQYLRGDDYALNEEELRGMALFFSPAAAGGANCLFCHNGPELTAASVRNVEATGVTQVLSIPGFLPQLRDTGYFYIGVRHAFKDIGLGGVDPTGEPLAEAARLPANQTAGAHLTVHGSFKSPGLHNVALTAPYFHDGSQLTLYDVVEFYARGGDVHPLLTPEGVEVVPLAVLDHLDESDKQALVAFMQALTDERVLFQQAPFDHPQLLVPNGHPGDEHAVASDQNGQALDQYLEIPAVGRFGGKPLASFLDTYP